MGGGCWKNKAPLRLSFGALSKLKIPGHLKMCDLLTAFLTSKHYEECGMFCQCLRIKLCRWIKGKNTFHHKNRSNRNIIFFLNYPCAVEIVCSWARDHGPESSFVVQDLLWGGLRVLQVWVQALATRQAIVDIALEIKLLQIHWCQNSASDSRFEFCKTKRHSGITCIWELYVSC